MAHSCDPSIRASGSGVQDQQAVMKESRKTGRKGRERDQLVLQLIVRVQPSQLSRVKKVIFSNLIIVFFLPWLIKIINTKKKASFIFVIFTGIILSYTAC